MPTPRVTVVVPTLAADEALGDCLRSLQSQTLDQFEIVVVDNSGSGRAQAGVPGIRVITNRNNVGFGAAVNQGWRDSEAPYLATLNDDAVAHPRWLELLVEAAEARPNVGMVASEVRMARTDTLDSAGMLIAADGSTKQRGHGESPEKFARAGDALFPSGSAALYCRKMLDQVGWFDESFFLYCEDSDLGLRGRWAGWECAYAPGAVVEHRYSHSAGRASPLKAYLVERNRLYLVIKNFPMPMLVRAPFASLARYFWHLVLLAGGKGKAAEFRTAGHSGILLPFLVLRAYFAALFQLSRLLGLRGQVRGTRRITPRQFRDLLHRHSLGVREVAAL